MGASHTQRPRIAIVLAQLRGAGIQRMRLNIVNELIRDGYMVDLVVGKKAGALVTSVPKEVAIYEIAKEGKLHFFFGLVGYLRDRRPSHILSSYEDISVMVICANWLNGSPSKVLVSVHNAVSETRNEGGPVNRFKWRVLLSVLPYFYKRTAAIVAVSQGVASDLTRAVGIPAESIRVIYNPVIASNFESNRIAPIPYNLDMHTSVPQVGFFGRLHPQKQVQNLVRAFAQVRAKRRCRLLLVGEGEEEENLRNLTECLGLGEDVVFCGQSKNPYPIMGTCSVIVLPSAYEGFGNVLIEALACGVQVISTDCHYGPAEILEGGRWGQLVPVGDVSALEAAIDRSLDKKVWMEPEALKARGLQFSAAKATDEYLAALGLPPRWPGALQ